MARTTPDACRAQVRGVLESLTPCRQLADSEDLFAAGVVKSIHLMQLITAVEDTFGFEVTQRDVHDGHLRSIDRLVAFVLARQAS